MHAVITIAWAAMIIALIVCVVACIRHHPSKQDYDWTE